MNDGDALNGIAFSLSNGKFVKIYTLSEASVSWLTRRAASAQSFLCANWKIRLTWSLCLTATIYKKTAFLKNGNSTKNKVIEF